MTEPHVSVIIATWNAGEVLGECLDSLGPQRVSGGFETIVVDNASSDATAELLRKRTVGVRVISNDVNIFYGAANNQAAALARGSILFFLNPDTKLLAPDVIERLAQAVEQPGVAMAGPRLVNPDGTLQASCGVHPSVPVALLLSSGLHRLLPDRIRAKLAPEHWSHNRSVDTGWVKGAALAVRKDVFDRVGGFWTRAYGEEQELAYRMKRLGTRVRFESSAPVMHVGRVSIRQRWSDAERAGRIAKADIAFLQAHYPPGRRVAIRAIFGTGFALRALAYRTLGRRVPAAVYAALARTYAGRSRTYPE